MNWKFLLATVVYVVSFAILMLHCNQEEFQAIIFHYSLAFFAYIYFVFSRQAHSFYALLALGIVLRLIAVYVFPNLSDDIYRFYWDGKLWADGIHPFDFTPRQLMEQGRLGEDYQASYELLNSKDYFTIYPPLGQLIFYFSTLIGGSIKATAVVMKLLYLIIDVLSVFGLAKILEHFNRNKNWAFVYFLNPLIIAELVGNIHAEVLMVGSLVWMVYFLLKNKYWQAGLFYGLAILSKILPFLFGPLLLVYLIRKKNWFYFFLSSGLLVLIGFGLMLMGSDLSHLMKSINLYFQSFEFNAGFYYLSRWVGYLSRGYNMIGVLGPVLAVTSLGLILWSSYLLYASEDSDEKALGLEKKFVSLFCLQFLIYLLFSTTIHPWYLAVPIAFAVFNRQLVYPMIMWSFLIMLSYSAYDSEPTQEHSLILVIEYGLVFLSFVVFKNWIEEF